LRRFFSMGLRSAFFIDYQLHKVISDYRPYMLLNNKYLIPAFSSQYDPPTLVKVNYNSDQSCIVKKPTTQV